MIELLGAVAHALVSWAMMAVSRSRLAHPGLRPKGGVADPRLPA